MSSIVRNPAPVKPAPVKPALVKPAPILVKPAKLDPMEVAKQKAQQSISEKQAEMVKAKAQQDARFQQNQEMAKAKAQQDMSNRQSEMAKAKAVESAKMRQDQDMAKARVAKESDLRSDPRSDVGDWSKPIKGPAPSPIEPTSFTSMNPSSAVGDALGSAMKTMGMKRGGNVQTTRVSSMSRSKKSSNW